MEKNPKDYEYLTSILFNSNDRPIGEPINNNIINTNVALKGVDCIALRRIQICANLYQFNQYNHTLNFKYGPAAGLVDYSISLLNTSFITGTILATYIEPLIRTATGDAGITITFNTFTNKLVFTATGVNFFKINIRGASYGLGFGVQRDGQTLYPAVLVNPLNSQYPIMMKQTCFIDIASNYLCQYQYEPNSGSSYKIPSKTLHRVRLNSNQLEYMYDYPVRDLMFIPWKCDEILSGAFDLRLLDEFGNLLDSQNTSYNFEIACFRKKKY